MLKCVLAHELDESQYHLHLVVADGGKSMKRHSAGGAYVHALLAEKPQATRKEQALQYRAGLSEMQQWYFDWGGRPFGHVRAPTPRKRMPKREILIGQKKKLDEAEELLGLQKKAVAAALRERKAGLEAEAIALQRREQAVADAEAQILAQAAMLKEALARLNKREAKSVAMREAVVDQLAVEQAIARNWYEPPSVF
jgi:hypothetical protein